MQESDVVNGPDDEGQGPLERAVERERDAIKLHEGAARHLEEMAARLERSSAHDQDELLQQEAMEAAANARRRARSARARAATVRERLREEGFDSDE